MPCEVVLLRVDFFKMAAVAIADITPPHYFGTSVSMVMPF
jgi:hypothetical protein